MRNCVFLIISSLLLSLNAIHAQMNYADLTVFASGLNVPNEIVFDTSGYLYVANHSYASYSGPYTNTIAKIDAAGNKTVFIGGYAWPSGLAIDAEQNIYLTQGNASSNITKLTPSGVPSTFATLTHQPCAITLSGDVNPANFTIYTSSLWGGRGIQKTLSNGAHSVFNSGAFNACEVSGDGQYLYSVTGPNNNMVRFNTTGGTFENWVTILQDYAVWGSTIGPDGKPYFIARSICDVTKKAIFRINGYNDVTEVVNNLPYNSEFNDLAFKENGTQYDLYVSQVLDGNRQDPASNRIIKYTNVFAAVSPLAVSVTIASSANNICSGAPVTFTATPVNGGTSPLYQWKVNGTNAGSNNPVFTCIPANNDVVTCVLTSMVACAPGNPATSNAITMLVTPSIPVSVSITASANPVCQGDTVHYTAHMVNAGSNAALQ